MRILIVEDEEKLAKPMKKVLEGEGYAVDHLADGESAERRIEMNQNDYDIVILDLMLPRRSGFEVCQNIRKFKIDIPILVLTAKGEMESKVSLLNCGADDYMMKPFDFAELLARIRALTRRPKKAISPELKIADLMLDLNNKKLFRDGKEISLTLKEFRLLEYFMRRPNQVVDRVNLTDNIWDFDYDSHSNTLDVYINRLRSKIDNGRLNKLLETVRGIGYRLKV